MVQILSVALKNFKTHRDRSFSFQLGTNAISGENGAGKTSILEAIAWVLFNHLGNYKKEDLIRNGSGSAQATVTFVSSRDGRTYDVQRCTQQGYTLFDPQIGQRLPYTKVKDEVMPWLRQQLGVAPGTDLGRLFSKTIGVPQGTFTADFLQTVEDRKRVFDAILKVEEYRAVFSQTSSLRKYADAQVEDCQRQIQNYEAALAGWDDLTQRQQNLQRQIQADQAQLSQRQEELKTLAQQRQGLQAQAQALEQAVAQVQTCQGQLKAQGQTQQLLRQTLAQATAAVAACDQNRADYEGYQAAEAQLQQLDQQRQRQQRLFQQRQTLQTQLNQRQAEVTKLGMQLEAGERHQAEITALEPLVAQQQQLEAQLQALAQQQAQGHQAKLRQQSLTQQLQQLQQAEARTVAKLQQLDQIAADLTTIPDLEGKCDRILAQLSRLQAAQQFQAELQRLVHQGQQQQQHYATQVQGAQAILATLGDRLPAHSRHALEIALETGVSLSQTTLDALGEILQDLSAQVNEADLQAQLNQQRQQLDQRYQQRADYATRPQHQAEQQRLQQQQQQLQAELAALEPQVQAVADLPQQQQKITQQLQTLNDPRGRSRILQDGIAANPDLRQRYDQLQQTQADLTQQLEATTQGLAELEPLAEQVNAVQQLRQQHQPGYLTYVQNQQQAQQQPKLATDLATATEALERLAAQLTQAQAHQASLGEAFDPTALAQLEANLSRCQSAADQLTGSLPQQRQLLTELTRQVDQLTEIAEKCDRSRDDLQQRQRLKRFVNFARKTYKEAGPRITERYVQQISREADRLFRELLNRPNVALTWTRDYEILVQEGPNNRRFVNLSGGEQMCAALAVRLALLKVLADIDIAFFDEPTTNMDKPRRTSLAESISRIKSFQQLFVISHDDTFEQVTENIIWVERFVD